jgi:U3 small nucleolar RNA-associated protein 15
LVKSISRFQDLAYSGTIRDDGKLMVAGDASGVVQVSYITITIRRIIINNI